MPGKTSCITVPQSLVTVKRPMPDVLLDLRKWLLSELFPSCFNVLVSCLNYFYFVVLTGFSEHNTSS